jgi:hypothetical protein
MGSIPVVLGMISLLFTCGILSKKKFLGKSPKRLRKIIPTNLKFKFLKNSIQFKSRTPKNCSSTHSIYSIFFKTRIDNLGISVLFYILYFKIINT